MAKRGGTFLQRWRVPFGFLCAAAFVFFARPFFWSLIVGGLIAVVGVLIRAWAAGHIRKNAQLAISGPYSHTRNPLYFGSFLLGLGFTVAAANVWLVLLFAAWFFGIYLSVMKTEAADVSKLFPDDYEDYAANVPLFLPRLTAWAKDGAKKRFDFSLYLKYREYRAGFGLLAAWSLLLAKATFF